MRPTPSLRYLLVCASALSLITAILHFGAWTSLGQPTGNQQPQAPTPQKGRHPYPQPQPAPSQVTVAGDTITVVTGQSVFPACNPPAQCDPFTNPPGANLLPTFYTNVYDSAGNEIPNTLPSTPIIPYNLHDGDPKVTVINPSGDPTNTPSPQDDLRFLFNAILVNAQTRKDAAIQTAITCALNILEGEKTCGDRSYSGLPLLHFEAGKKVKRVDPATRNVDIHQVWYDTHIESDTAYLDVRGVAGVPWTITYTVDVLNRGHDDFSPFAMFYDVPPPPVPGTPSPAPSMPPPGVGMDQTFFNMEDGTRTIFKIKMPAGKYFNLVYTWGWRAHPPRVQVTENACKTIPFTPPAADADCSTAPNTLVSWERRAFYNNGTLDKNYAIGKLSRYAPEVLMWTALRDAQDALKAKQYDKIIDLFRTMRDASGQPGIARVAWDDWRDRTKWPRGLPANVVKDVVADKDTDLSLFYLGNTIYGHFNDGSRMDFPKWKLRGTELKVTLYNGDYFDHGYQNVDFGGARGWENQFKSSVKTGGSGCWFTFGRVWWWMNIPPKPELNNMAMVTVPAATRATTPGGEDQFGVRKVHITFNYEPSRRLRFYQFDPVHHDVAVFSVH